MARLVSGRVPERVGLAGCGLRLPLRLRVLTLVDADAEGLLDGVADSILVARGSTTKT